MPKQIVILDPNGIEVANFKAPPWSYVVRGALDQLYPKLAAQNPKLGTYTVTVKEVE